MIAQEIYLLARTGQVEKAALLAESFDSEKYGSRIPEVSNWMLML